MDAAVELNPLVRETTIAIGALARRGSKLINGLVPDKDFPVSLARTGGGFFREMEIVTRVSPKINAVRSIDGFSDLAVVSAQTNYTTRRHYFTHLGYFDADNEPSRMELPFSRRDQALTLGMSSSAESTVGSANWDGDYNVGITASGVAYRDVRYIESQPLTTHPESNSMISRYETADEVQRVFYKIYPESLALAGLVARGLQAFDLELDSGHAKALFNDWQDANEQPRLDVHDQLWTASQNTYLTDHLTANAS